jgi:uncharacterized protein
MSFEWDGRKNDANLSKHGIDFHDATGIFDGPVLERSSDRHGEARTVAVGILEHRVVVMVYTWRGDNRRIISERRARNDEKEAYHRHCGY